MEHGYIVFPESGDYNRTSAHDPEENTIDRLSGRTYHYDDIIGFSCYRGYKFRGNHNLLTEFRLQCSINGTWMGFVPDCVPRVCPWPNRVGNAKIFLKERDSITLEIPVERNAISDGDRTAWKTETGETFPLDTFVSGTKIVVVCDPGYELSGDAIRTCSEEEIWSPAFVSCEPRNCSVGDNPFFKFFKKLENETAFGNNANVLSLDLKKKWNGVGNVTNAYKSFQVYVEGSSYGQRVILTCQNDAQMNLDKLLIANETVLNITWVCNETANWQVSNLLLNESALEQLFNDPTYICDGSCAPAEVSETSFFFFKAMLKDFNVRRVLREVFVMFTHN